MFGGGWMLCLGCWVWLVWRCMGFEVVELRRFLGMLGFCFCLKWLGCIGMGFGMLVER